MKEMVTIITGNIFEVSEVSSAASKSKSHENTNNFNMFFHSLNKENIR